MLIYHCETFTLVISILCLASAFSTQFIIEGVDETRKNQEGEEIKTQKIMENNEDEKPLNLQTLKVKVVPLMTNSFTQTEDVINITPLKLVTAVAAEHLLTSLQNIPVGGNSPQDTLDMLGNIVKEINKTAEIIKLTAEYVNISGNYILSTLNRYANTSCNKNSVEEVMSYVKKNFLKSIDDHILGAIKELNEKTRQREMTGSDILISSAYHIVAAFQEMTNEILSLTSESNKKCSVLLPDIDITLPSDEVINGTEKKTIEDVLTVQVIPEQGKRHKSIKKDQALPKTEAEVKVDFRNLQDQLTLENLKENQDLTSEVFSPEAIFQNYRKEPNSINSLKSLGNLKVNYIPLKTISLFKNPELKKLNEKSVKEHGGFAQLNQNKSQTEKVDRELASSAVDSLSNMPWMSLETKDMRKAPEKSTDRLPQSLINVWDLLSSGYHKPLQFQPKKQEDELVEPVCGIDKTSKKFIIFLNDYKREAHNKVHETNYVWSSMDTCVSFFLRNPDLLSSTNQVNNIKVDLRPR